VFSFILAERANFPVKVMCEVLGVSRAGFYAWANRKPSLRSQRDAVLLKKIRCIHKDSRQTYGSPRIHVELKEDHGILCGRKRVARLMAAHGIRGCCRRRRHWTTRKDASSAPSEDLLNRDFTADAPNMRWVADITYVSTWQGFLHVAFVLDLFSRKIVGWAMATHLRTELVLDALGMAVLSRRPGKGLIHHSDHGCQYTSVAFSKRCREAGIITSMGSVGDAYDNAAAEAFIASLKTELIYRRSWRTRDEVELAIFDYIEVFYNPRRRHTTIGAVSPVAFEDAYAKETALG
jgi:putative transposase